MPWGRRLRCSAMCDGEYLLEAQTARARPRLLARCTALDEKQTGRHNLRHTWQNISANAPKAKEPEDLACGVHPMREEAVEKKLGAAVHGYHQIGNALVALEGAVPGLGEPALHARMRRCSSDVTGPRRTSCVSGGANFTDFACHAGTGSKHKNSTPSKGSRRPPSLRLGLCARPLPSASEWSPGP